MVQHLISPKRKSYYWTELGLTLTRRGFGRIWFQSLYEWFAELS